MQRHHLQATIWGAISGILSATLLPYAGQYSIYWFPGTVFGTAFAIHLLIRTSGNHFNISILLGLLFAGLSTIAYRTAVFVVTSTSRNIFALDHSSLVLPRWAQGLSAGIVGAFVLILSIRVCRLGQPSIGQATLTLVLGSVLGLLYAVPYIKVSEYELNQLILFVPWQAGIFASLAATATKLP